MCAVGGRQEGILALEEGGAGRREGVGVSSGGHTPSSLLKRKVIGVGGAAAGSRAACQVSDNSCAFPAGPIFMITHICSKGLFLRFDEEPPWVSLARLRFEGGQSLVKG